MAQQVLSITQVNEYIRSRMDADPLLNSIAVKGEISNYKVYPSGHHYFTLKDESSQLKCVMFKGDTIPGLVAALFGGTVLTLTLTGNNMQIAPSRLTGNAPGPGFFPLICSVLLLIFGIMLVIMVAICIGTFLVTLHNAPDKPSDSGVVTYYFGGAQVRQAKTKSAVVGDEVYFCFNDLADYLGMSETGSALEMKFIMPVGENAALTAAGDGTEDSIVFLTDKTSIILNGQLVVMKVPNLLRGTEVWVSADFVADFMENLSLTYDERKREMRISRIIDEALSTDEEPVYLTPVFTLKRMNAIEPIPEDPLVGDVSFSADSADGAVSDVLSFKADVSAYEAYMNPEGDMRDAFLMLANSENPLGAEHSLSGFYEVANVSVITPMQYLEEYAAKALEAMFKEMKANEFYSMAVYAGYRSYYEQSDLFEAQVAALQSANASLSRSQAEENASMHVSRPGCDDHQTGLAVDMDTWGCVDTNFQFEAEYKWLSENAWKFGFILRYPRDKTDETDHVFEPWHYRYVGRYHAQKIYATGLCLEEYLERIR